MFVRRLTQAVPRGDVDLEDGHAAPSAASRFTVQHQLKQQQMFSFSLQSVAEHLDFIARECRRMKVSVYYVCWPTPDRFNMKHTQQYWPSLG